MKSIRRTWLRPGTIVLSIATLVVLAAAAEALSLETASAVSPAQSIALSASSSASALRGPEALLPFLGATAMVLLAGLAVIAGRRRLARLGR